MSNRELIKSKFEEWAVVNNLRIDRQKSMCGGDMGRYDFGPAQACYEVYCDAWEDSRSELCVDLPMCTNESQDAYYKELVDELETLGVKYK